MTTKMMDDLQMGVSIFEATAREKLASSKSANEQLEIAFREIHTFDFWWAYNVSDDMRFKTAIGAVLLQRKDDEEFREEVKYQMRALASLSALISGLPIDMSSALDGERGEPPFQLMAMYKESLK